MNELVRLRIRPSRDGKRFTYFLDYLDENCRRRRLSLSDMLMGGRPRGKETRRNASCEWAS